MSTYDEEEVIGTEDVPFDVTEDIDVGDLSDQQGGGFPASTRVVGEIRKASVKPSLENNKYSFHPVDNKVCFKSLHLEIKIGEAGTDGEGANAGRICFTSIMDIVLTYDEAACRRKKEAAGGKFNAAWWANEARFGAKQFFTATQGSAKNVRVNDELLIALVGSPIMFDIKPEKGNPESYRLQNWRAVEQGEE